MTERMEELERRVAELEERMDVMVSLTNHFMELVYEPRFIRKLDKLARHEDEFKGK